MNKPVSPERYLEEHGSLTWRNTGTSMLPLLKEGRDLFTVTKKGSGRCRKGDVVLYRRGKQLVLHRVVEVREKDYVILGDGCVRRETGVTDDDILGVMTGFVRRGREHRTDEPGYRLYTRLWMAAAPLRIPLQKAVRRLRRTAEKE